MITERVVLNPLVNDSVVDSIDSVDVLDPVIDCVVINGGFEVEEIKVVSPVVDELDEID